MNQPKNCIATSALILFAALFAAAGACAAEIGAVTHLSGPLLARKADGVMKILAPKSIVEAGDMLLTENDTYAQIRFADDSEITLRPNSQLKIERFAFDSAKPENDQAVFNVSKGAVRVSGGQLARRSPERFSLMTPASSIAMRGSASFIAEYIPENRQAIAAYGRANLAALDGSYSSATMTDAPRAIAPIVFDAPRSGRMLLAQNTPPAPGGGGLAPGLYVHVIDGIINLSNRGGSQSFSAGQFGYTASFIKPPIVVPNNPGLQFTPPASFSSSTSNSNSSNSSKSNTVDCEVR